MAIQSKNTLKYWFIRYAKPTASQFADLFDSFWHKSEVIAISAIEGLENILNNIYSYIDAQDSAKLVEAKNYTDLKGLVNETNWCNVSGTSYSKQLIIDSWNIVEYNTSDGEMTLIKPTGIIGKSAIIQPRSLSSEDVNIVIPDVYLGGADSELGNITITKRNQVVHLFYDYYGWHVVSHSNLQPDISSKVDISQKNVAGGYAGLDENTLILVAQLQAIINDASSSDTNKTWSNSKINATINTAIANLVASSPSTLDTLKELADALGDDANFATTVSTQLGLKVNTSDIIDVLTSTVTNKPLSANQGYILKGMLDALTTTVGGKQNTLTDTSLGTLEHGFSAKNTPIDADEITFLNSVSSFVKVKTTLSNFWSNYLYPKVLALFIKKQIGTYADRIALTGVADGDLFYQTDMTVGLYLRQGGVWIRTSQANTYYNLVLYNYATTQQIGSINSGTVTKIQNVAGQLTGVTYRKYTKSTNSWSGSTSVTFTSDIATVSIAVAVGDALEFTGTIVGANTFGTLEIEVS